MPCMARLSMRGIAGDQSDRNNKCKANIAIYVSVNGNNRNAQKDKPVRIRIIFLRWPVTCPSQADSSCAKDASSSGTDARKPICVVLAFRNTAKAVK